MTEALAPHAFDPSQGLGEEVREDAGAVELMEIARVGFVIACAAIVWFRMWEPFDRVSLVGVVGTCVGGWPILREAWENIRDRRMTMELSMTIALAAALGIGEFFTALVITAFVLVAETLEGLTVGRGRRAIRDLLSFLPATATVRREDGVLHDIALGDLQVGDVVLVAPGARVPADGLVRGGESFIDQATITGESTPVRKVAGDLVYAGTINQSGALEVVADRIGRDSSFGRIIEAVERAERSRAPVQKTADRYAGYLVYFALACAVITYAITRDTRSTISVIIVAGACGIAAGTPLAVLGAIGRAARGGAIIKGGRHLEALWSVSVIAFDKTGTLTVGAPVVREIRTAAAVSEQQVLHAAAIAERRSEHPLARAILRRAQEQGVAIREPDRFEYLPGQGVVVRDGVDEIIAGSRTFLAEHWVTEDRRNATSTHAVVSEVLVARNRQFLGTILVADAVRAEAPAAMHALRSLGIMTVLLTGDTRAVADAVGEELAMDEVDAELLPDHKARIVESLAAGTRTVAMVGDGINDAPALARATVGIAMGSGTDVARDSADIVLLGNDLMKLVDTVRIARRARDIIRFNFAGTLIVDGVGVGLAACGLLHPLLAALIHVSSEMIFILNSARLLPTLSRIPRGR